jgi:hypothetical protein
MKTNPKEQSPSCHTVHNSNLGDTLGTLQKNATRQWPPSHIQDCCRPRVAKSQEQEHWWPQSQIGTAPWYICNWQHHTLPKQQVTPVTIEHASTAACKYAPRTITGSVQRTNCGVLSRNNVAKFFTSSYQLWKLISALIVHARTYAAYIIAVQQMITAHQVLYVLKLWHDRAIQHTLSTIRQAAHK